MGQSHSHSSQYPLNSSKKNGNNIKYPTPLPRPRDLMKGRQYAANPSTATLSANKSYAVSNESNFMANTLANGIMFHEQKEFNISAYYFSVAASRGDPTGLFLYAVSLRHGWGVDKNEKEAFRLLELVTESVGLVDVKADLIVHADHIPLALLEIGMSLQQGWGVSKDLEKAAYYFQLAANLGDRDAQVALAECYLRGDGVLENKKMAATWFRRAEKQGARLVQMQWIWKEKYDDPKI